MSNQSDTPKNKLSKILKEVEEEIEREGISFAYASLVDLATDLTEELTAARDELSESQQDYKCLAELLDGHDATECRMNLVRLKEQRDRLAETVGLIANRGQSIEPDHWKFREWAREISQQAIQSLTPQNTQIDRPQG